MVANPLVQETPNQSDGLKNTKIGPKAYRIAHAWGMMLPTDQAKVFDQNQQPGSQKSLLNSRSI